MKEFFKQIINSFFYPASSGFDPRNLSAFLALVTAIVYTFVYGSPTYIEIIVLIWLGFALLCLGVITIQQVIEFKNGSNSVN
jgi:hypothetical protein